MFSIYPNSQSRYRLVNGKYTRYSQFLGFTNRKSLQTHKNMTIEIEDQTLALQARTSFVRKVYSILSIQLATTIGFILLNITYPAFAEFQANSPFLTFFMSISAISSLFALVFSPSLCQIYPRNWLVLGLFTVSQSYLVSRICGFYTPMSVLMVASATATAICGITLFAVLTKYDFSDWMTTFYAYTTGLFGTFLFVSLYNVFIFHAPFIDTLISFILTALYCGFILTDTQLLLVSQDQQLQLDNHIFGAVILYADVIGLFLRLLDVLGTRKTSKI